MNTLPEAARDSVDLRLLVLAPIGRDAPLTATVLGEAGIQAIPCRDIDDLVEKIAEGAGAVLIAEEALAHEKANHLTEAVGVQPAWSDLPFVLLTRPGGDSPVISRALQSLGNVTLLERPTRVATLLSVVKTALRARQRQYQVRDHLDQRRKAEEKLQEADRRKDEFLATLAHELRNPLAPIRNSLNILRLLSREDPTLEKVGEVIERQVNHMVRLVDDLLEVSRITRGKIELRKEPIDLAAVIRSAVETSNPLIEANGHQLAISLPSEPIIIDGDMIRLAQVFANLLNNAAKYTDTGGQIWLTARCEGADVIVSVRDTGTGIPAELLPKVFDMFTQAHAGTGRTQGGLGIGLTLVKRLVEMHGGSVEVKSSVPGQGTEFVVRLPTAGECPRAAQPAPALPAVLGPRRILVVDDNRDAADSLAALLKLLGADLQVAYSGPAAVEALRRFRPQVVLLDIGMPGMDGYDVARWVRQQPDLRGVTLVALTGWGQEEARRRSREAGFDHHLIKPADVGMLQTLLNSLGAGV